MNQRKFLSNIGPDELLLVTVAIIGVLFRCLNLGVQGAWNDEMASLYYAKYPLQAFLSETHPPLFYFALSPFVDIFGKNLLALRLVVVSFSLILITACGLLARRIFAKRGAALLTILLLLSHIDIIHGRMLRHYALFTELTVLYLLSVQVLRPRAICLIGTLLAFVHPLGFIPPLTLGLINFWKEKSLSRRLWIFIGPTSAIVVYYLAKITFVAKDFRPVARSEKVFPFLEDILRAFAGEHYPKINFGPVPNWFVLSFSALLIGILLYGIWRRWRDKRMEPELQNFFLILIVTMVVTQLVTHFFFNLSVGRYYLFLLAPYFLVVVSLFARYRWSCYIACVIQLFILFQLNPLQTYPQESDAFDHYEQMTQTHPGLELVLCGTEYQYDYFLDRPKENCVEKMRLLRQQKKSFGLVDLSGLGRTLISEARGDYAFLDLKIQGVSVSALALYQGQNNR